MPTKIELKQHAKELNIKGYSKMKKEHLESAIYLRSVCAWYDQMLGQDIAGNSLRNIYDEISGNTEIGQQE